MPKLRTDAFHYELPRTLIAQHPSQGRGESRLLVMGRDTGEISHDAIHGLGRLLGKNDVLVFNDTKVMKARLFGRKVTGGAVECLLTEPSKDGRWLALLRPSKRLKAGDIITVQDSFGFQITQKNVRETLHEIAFTCDADDVDKYVNRLGSTPLPPYIGTAKRNQADGPGMEAVQNRYQTVFAKHLGSSAAPTAGLHFTQSALASLQEKGVAVRFVTLHIGYDTFKPVETEFIEDHIMHNERYALTEDTASFLTDAKKEGRNIVAVGTTACRVLESAWNGAAFLPGESQTDIFIYPGYRFGAVDKLITNFHLPSSSLLALVSAFAGRAAVLQVYAVAVKERYRFYSFGDAMLIH